VGLQLSTKLLLILANAFGEIGSSAYSFGGTRIHILSPSYG
jgi:hypothetical protein